MTFVTNKCYHFLRLPLIYTTLNPCLSSFLKCFHWKFLYALLSCFNLIVGLDVRLLIKSCWYVKCWHLKGWYIQTSRCQGLTFQMWDVKAWRFKCQVLTSQGLIYPDIKMSRLDISNVRCQVLTFQMWDVKAWRGHIQYSKNQYEGWQMWPCQEGSN